MGYLKAILRLLYTVTGPGVMLFYPLYASLKALETPSAHDDRQWLTYWILYSFLTFFECSCWHFLQWLPIWPFMKLGICIWLVLPSLNGAAYIYNNLVKKYVNVGNRVRRNDVRGASSRQSLLQQVRGASSRQSPLHELGALSRQSPLNGVGISSGQSPSPLNEVGASTSGQNPPNEVGTSSGGQNPLNEVGASSRQSPPNNVGASPPRQSPQTEVGASRRHSPQSRAGASPRQSSRSRLRSFFRRR